MKTTVPTFISGSPESFKLADWDFKLKFVLTLSLLTNLLLLNLDLISTLVETWSYSFIRADPNSSLKKSHNPNFGLILALIHCFTIWK